MISINGCVLTFQLTPRNRSVSQVGPNAFKCGYTASTWADIAGLGEPFIADAEGFQWLDRIPAEAALLLSAMGEW